MRRLALVVAALFAVGCGGGGDSSIHAPSVSNLAMAPRGVTLNEGGGVTNIGGSIDFRDNGGDLAEVRLEVYDSGGTLLDSLVLPVQADGIKQGSVVGTFAVATTSADVYVIKINVKDRGGNVSNTESGMFVIHLPASGTNPAVLESGHTVIRLSGATGLDFGSARASSVSIGPSGDVYVGDPSWGRIYKLDALSGSKTLHASGLPSGMPRDICWTPSGKMFATGNASGGNVFEVTTGSPVPFASVPGLPRIRGIAGDTLFAADGSNTIWKISPAGVPTAFLSGLRNPASLALDNAGFLYYSTMLYSGTAISRIPTVGTSSPALVVPLLPAADYIAVDGAGNLYASDYYTASIYKAEGGKVTLFASGFSGYSLFGPAGLAFDNTGALYVADADNLWKITTP